MPEHIMPESDPSASPELEAYLKFNETLGAIELLLARGYSEHQNLRQLKQEIEFELKAGTELGTLSPKQTDRLLDSLNAATHLLGLIEKSTK